MKQGTPIRNSVIIAIVDDDDSVRTALESLLRSSGYKVQTYCSALEFLNTNGPAQTHCLISDIQMPGMSGLELHKQLVAMGFHIPTIFITAYPEALSPLSTNTPALIACLPKPCDANKLLNYIETALLQQN
ncbi:response regulator transcription factor [Pseudomonas sp. PDM09]|uniref:response regulator transcription factor n=1 Tax=Pseudomonas sp. PDM09 TaxID=2769270 RepID=UPI001786A7A5|nr:response regulator [Pseudomonas sp. PDM09]MBD9562742.1 response regulator [Pseudomonas sp. PDM09]